MIHLHKMVVLQILHIIIYTLTDIDLLTRSPLGLDAINYAKFIIYISYV